MLIVPLFLRVWIIGFILAAGVFANETLAAAGDLYTKDFAGPIFRISPDGTKTFFAAGDGSTTARMALDRAGNLYVAAQFNILKFAPDGTQTTFAVGVSALDLVFD